MRPGLWSRAGMAGEITGLDWSALRALVPASADADRVLALAALFEDGMLRGRNSAAERDRAMEAAREEMESLTPPE